MKKLTVAITVVVLMLAFGLSLTAQPGPGGRRGGGAFGQAGDGAPLLGYIARHLDLTDDQKAEVKKIAAAERTMMQPIHEQMRKNRTALQEATKEGQFNESEVTQLAQEQGQLMAQMIVSRERVKSQVYKILTPEQREKLAEVGERFRERGERPMRQGRRSANKPTDN